MHDLDALANRLRKLLKTRRSWAKREGTDAFRLYEMDIPELRYVVDLYGEHAVIWDKRGDQTPDEPDLEQRLIAAVGGALDLPAEQLHLKMRRRPAGSGQYRKLAETRRRQVVHEEDARYLVNLDDYLDTGLFLDHRPLRKSFRRLPSGTRFLNLFCYTGSVSVAAAQSGARVTSVDLSNTYLDWAIDNFRENRLDPAAHAFERTDALRWLAAGPQRGERFDVIFLDPPTFSNSKRMPNAFDVQRDHVQLIHDTMRFLQPGGDAKLVFSTNRHRFVLHEELAERYDVKDISDASVPEDFRDKKVHRAFEIKALPR
jgi:23S rRNA G2069 N7-methylase RlmK/C1962 C5-methylase RlmI